jgi:hypothetical protein
MSKIEELERQVQGLSVEELAHFREWFAAYDAETWDREFAADVAAGKLAQAAADALKDHAAGRSTLR